MFLVRHLTLILPIFLFENVCCICSNALQATFIIEANTMNPEHTSSLIWVHNVCNIGYQVHAKAEDIWQE